MISGQTRTTIGKDNGASSQKTPVSAYTKSRGATSNIIAHPGVGSLTTAMPGSIGGPSRWRQTPDRLVRGRTGIVKIAASFPSRLPKGEEICQFIVETFQLLGYPVHRETFVLGVCMA
jgi:hypothetical protein